MSRRWLAMGAVAALGVVAAATWFELRRDPDIVWLSPAGGAQWIRYDRPFKLTTLGRGLAMRFSTDFELAELTGPTTLVVYALESPIVRLDGRLLYAPDPAGETRNWKAPIRVDVGPLLAGRHQLSVTVSNLHGPTALLAHAESLGVATGPDWVAGVPKRLVSRPALPVTTLRRPEVSERFSVLLALRDPAAQGLAGLFALTFAAALALPRVRIRAGTWIASATPAGGLRWLLIVAWLVLAANNFDSLNLERGFDRSGHEEYIDFLVERGRVPLATEGWQMFQSPLYYALAAVVRETARILTDTETAWRLVILLSVAAGTTQVEIAFRALRAVFPQQHAAQCLGLLVSGLMPMSLYQSQAIGNEPLAALFAAAGVTLVIAGVQDPKRLAARRRQIGLGLLLGLALLTKVSAALLVLPVGVAVALARRRDGARPLEVALSVATVGVAVAVVSGWYYALNWIQLGTPFIGGWDPLRGIVWWQDPGYRTLGQLTAFGEALWHPVYAAYAGFWDSLYSTLWLDGFLSGNEQEPPPWNYPVMLLGAWLALLPSAALVLGAVGACLPSQWSRKPGLLFAASCVAVYLAAMFTLYLRVPIYTTAKATYTLALLPCYGVLAAAGFELLWRNRWLRAVLISWMTCWAIFAYLSYWVV